jgi:hypothetical protein
MESAGYGWIAEIFVVKELKSSVFEKEGLISSSI